MKHISLFALMILFAVSGAFAKDRVSKHTTVKGNFMSVTYGQPSKKGRVIFGGLVPYGEVWRTGADEATELTLNRDCMVAGKAVKAGTYTLYTIPGAQTWEVILNTKLNQWGAFDYEKIKSNDVLKRKVGVKPLDKSVETFTIDVMGDGLRLDWDQTSVFIDIKPM